MSKKRSMMGRPHSGRVKISQERINALPEEGSIQQFAVALGVSYETIRRVWMSCPTFPAKRERVTKYDHYRLKRDPVVRWLIETGRHTPRKEY